MAGSLTAWARIMPHELLGVAPPARPMGVSLATQLTPPLASGKLEMSH